MEIVGNIYPKRVLIKYKAKEQLRLMDDSEADQLLDEELFNEIAATFFRSPQNHKFAYPCHSNAEANEVANTIAAKLAETYRQIKFRQQNNTVQFLNGLL
ncbi:MAG: hypothetical protein ABI417_00095 [Coleofasciculaceae cyanobacterium]